VPDCKFTARVVEAVEFPCEPLGQTVRVMLIGCGSQKPGGSCDRALGEENRYLWCGAPTFDFRLAERNQTSGAFRLALANPDGLASPALGERDAGPIRFADHIGGRPGGDRQRSRQTIPTDPRLPTYLNAKSKRCVCSAARVGVRHSQAHYHPRPANGVAGPTVLPTIGAALRRLVSPRVAASAMARAEAVSQ
jgi:hypothetical protein